MKFCPSCHSRLPTILKTREHLVCSKCGARVDIEHMDSPRRINSQPISDNDIVVISEEELKLQVHPTVRIDCPKCDGTRASFWTTIVGDEEEYTEVQVFKCTKCRSTWREKG